MAQDDGASLLTTELAAAQSVLAPGEGRLLAHAEHGGLSFEVKFTPQALWVMLRREGSGGLALRFPVFGSDAVARVLPADGAIASVEWRGPAGHATLRVTANSFGLEQFRAQYCYTPAVPFRIGKLPRDIVPFDAAGLPDPSGVTVEAQQRKLNTALLYFTLGNAGFGKVLYVQNLTALNPYFNATGSKPENAVQADLPELGYSLPLNPETGHADLPAGKPIMLYDTILAVRAYPQAEEGDSAWQFLDMIGGIYPLLSPPEADFRHWPLRAEATVQDLIHAPEARIEHFGHVYFHPYTASEYPDVMVQLAIASALENWGRWKGVKHPLVREIMAGIEGFHDKDLKTLRRYLPNVGKDKDANAVDSWYLYHPMLNLANLAIAGNEQARELFLATIDYGIKAAHHFQYKWPILYDVRDFSVIQDVAPADQRGQTDVGGIYAWVMLQAFELTLERRFLDEAIAAIEAAKGMRFDLNYQANLTAWGAAACVRLWRSTDRKDFLKQSYVYLASFFHNAQIWNSDIGMARHWRNFLGVTCLQDAPYMAAYECFDSYSAFERYLDYGGPDLIPSVRLLLSEYCRHALDRAWFYYPDALPEQGVAKEDIRNGYILCRLNFPLEDLYPDGQPAGQVGQEIYGSGAALIYTTRSFRRIDGVPFLIWCDVFVRAVHKIDATTISMRIDGPAGTEARLALVMEDGRPLNSIEPRLTTSDCQTLPFELQDGRLEARLPADASLLLAWNENGR
ncbi:hypothetical protein C7W88_00345 [Novosphingobium sp. THN1]|uniref:hypothetical protein n=1 Tax=Novosphingobium sp. THN1 TaxID=1016987 RepID=UPI000E4CD287|nr:hypothetical protein [Novosphingobium sp. THN1]AXU17861.1 hypothetical protein C7W88_00345 [Novosphingobium sp. THN1]